MKFTNAHHKTSKTTRKEKTLPFDPLGRRTCFSIEGVHAICHKNYGFKAKLGNLETIPKIIQAELDDFYLKEEGLEDEPSYFEYSTEEEDYFEEDEVESCDEDEEKYFASRGNELFQFHEKNSLILKYTY